MFKKKKIEQQNNFANWEADFGFLQLILTRKKGITKNFLLSIYSSQKSEKDYMTDEEIEPIVTNIVTDVLNQLGEKYKAFLISKYFGSNESLIKYITEDVYVDIISDAINHNNTKIKNSLYKKILFSNNQT